MIKDYLVFPFVLNDSVKTAKCLDWLVRLCHHGMSSEWQNNTFYAETSLLFALVLKHKHNVLNVFIILIVYLSLSSRWLCCCVKMGGILDLIIGNRAPIEDTRTKCQNSQNCDGREFNALTALTMQFVQCTQFKIGNPSSSCEF